MSLGSILSTAAPIAAGYFGGPALAGSFGMSAAGGAIAAGGAGGGGAVVHEQSLSEICDPNGASAAIGFALLLSIVALAAHIVERMFAPRAEVRKTAILYSTTDNRTFAKTGSGQIQEKLKTKRENLFVAGAGQARAGGSAAR